MRYLKATILFGTISFAIVVTLFIAGWISTTPDKFLAGKYALGNPAVVPAGLQLLLIVFLAYATTWTTIDITRPALKTIIAFAAIFLIVTSSFVLALYNIF